MFVYSHQSSLSQQQVKSSSRVTVLENPPLVSVMVVGDDAHLRQNLQTLLNFYNLSASQKFNIVGEANSRNQALRITLEQQPSLILLDLDLFQEQDEAIKTLVELKNLLGPRKDGGKILVLSSHGEEKFIFRAMQAGAFGYLLKEHLPSQLHTAITTVSAGQIYMCPEVATKFFLMFHVYEGREFSDSNAGNSYSLTNREREVLKLLVQGQCNEEIGQRLCITVATVKAHLTAIFEKLGVKNRSRAIVRSLQLGIV